MIFPPLQANLSGRFLEKAIYVSPRGVSLTSLCEIIEGATRVYFDDASGHLQTAPLLNAANYYDTDYKILLNSAEEDQLYEVRDGQPFYRTAHQLEVLQQKVSLPHGARVLDYGCAKGAMMKLLCNARPDVKPHLFDVSEMYRPFWQELSLPENQATYEVPLAWENRFDLVMSFFVFEHIEAPIDAWRQIGNLLKPGGMFYGVVPNTLTNTADFIVVDHPNHFSELSLRYALTRAGFFVEKIDAAAHRGALLVVARRVENSVPFVPVAGEVAALREQYEAIATTWRGLSERVQHFESENKGRAAIYGSGFYGTFLSTCLQNWENVACFLDQNPFQQGKVLRERPVLAPESLPADVRFIYVGLNPAIARETMMKSVLAQRHDLQYFFLDSPC
jgi:SAM-dependent methyltransferase